MTPRLQGGTPGRADADRAIDQLTHHCVRAVSPSGDLVVLHVPSGVYLRLDGSASTIVDLLVDQGDADSAARTLAGRFDLPIEQARSDVDVVLRPFGELRASRGSRPRRPTGSGGMVVLRSWWRLPPVLKLAVVRATAMVVAVEAGLRLTDIGRLSERLHVPLAARSSDVPGPAEGDDRSHGDDAPVSTLSPHEQQMYWATSWVLDRWLFDGTCLRRALTQGYFLRRHHPTLHLGLIGEGDTSHAWVEAEGVSFNELPVTGLFTETRRRQDPPAG